jgi:hypothetical protein
LFGKVHERVEYHTIFDKLNKSKNGILSLEVLVGLLIDGEADRAQSIFSLLEQVPISLGVLEKAMLAS